MTPEERQQTVTAQALEHLEEELATRWSGNSDVANPAREFLARYTILHASQTDIRNMWTEYATHHADQ